MKYPLTVTLKDLRANRACFSGYNKVVRALQGREFTYEDVERDSYIRFSNKDPINISSIVASNGLDDAIWSLRCVLNVDRDARLFAVWCARQVQHLMTDQRSLNALDVAESFANGTATEAERAAAEAAAWAAARAVAWAAARAAAEAEMAVAWAAAGAAAGDAAWAAAGAAARDAARAAARGAARGAQSTMFIAMCGGKAPWQVGGVK